MSLHWIDAFESGGIGKVGYTNNAVAGWVGGGGIFNGPPSLRVGEGRYGSNCIGNEYQNGFQRWSNFPASEWNTWENPEFPGEVQGWDDPLSNGAHIFVSGMWSKTWDANGLGTYGINQKLFGVGQEVGYLHVTDGGTLVWVHRLADPVTKSYYWVEYGRSKGQVIHKDRQYFIELKLVMANPGSVVVRINEEIVMNLTGLDTRHPVFIDTSPVQIAYWCRWDSWWSPSKGPNLGGTVWDDIYLKDGLNETDNGDPNDFFLGDVRNATVYPIADNTQQWQPSTGGQNWSLVDDPVLDTTDYVEGDEGEKDLYDFSSIGPSYKVSAVYHFSQVTRVGDPDWVETTESGGPGKIEHFKTYTGEFTIDHLALVGGYERHDEVHYTLIVPGYWNQVGTGYLYNPATGLEWTATALNTAKFGYQVRQPSDPRKVFWYEELV